MSDQNNNNNPNQPQQGQPQQPQQPYQGQPQQPQQPYQPYQGQPQQPYQPYQGQPQQPYQPYQGQPQQPYQPYQGQPQQPYQPYQPYQAQPPLPPKKKSKWWIWLIVAVVVVLAVVALFVFGVIDLGGKRPGNEGAWKAYDYFDTRQDKLESIQSSVYKEVSDRFDTEAFEMEGDFKIKSDLFDATALGIDSFGADFQAKYDLKDLGLKLNLFDTVSADVYLIDEDLVVSVLGEAYAMPLDPNTDVDLSEEMPLSDRIDALSSLSTGEDFSELAEKVMAELAPAIPNELTEKDTVDVYSPLEDDEVEMKAVTTTLEKDEIYDIIVAFGENLDENQDLIDELQDFADTLSTAAGEEIDIQDYVDQMIDLDEDELNDMEDVTISWSVYEYKGEDVGFSLYIDNAGEEIELTMITQFTKNAAYISVKVDFNGDEAASIVEEILYDNEYMTLNMQVDVNSPATDYSDAQNVTLSLSGETTLDKDSSTEYAFAGDFTVDVDAGDSMSSMGLGGPMAIDVEANADILFGNDLGMLEDDNDWNEIYDMQWGDIENILDSLTNFGGLGNFGAFDYDGF